MKITVGFSKHKGFAPFSRLVCLIERTKYSHSYIKVYSQSLERNLIYHATGIGVYFIGERGFTEKAQIVEEYQIDVSDDAKTKFLQKAIDLTGRSYGFMEILGLGFVRLFALFNKKINNPFSNGAKSYICTELVAAILKDFSYELPDDLENIGLKELQFYVKKIAEENHG